MQGYTDADFKAAAAVHKRVGRYTMPLYKQAGNSGGNYHINAAYSKQQTEQPASAAAAEKGRKAGYRKNRASDAGDNNSIRLGRLLYIRILRRNQD